MMTIEQIYKDLSTAKEILKKLSGELNKDSILRTEILDAKSSVSDAYDAAGIEYDKWKAGNKAMSIGKEGEGNVS